MRTCITHKHTIHKKQREKKVLYLAFGKKCLTNISIYYALLFFKVTQEFALTILHFTHLLVHT